MKRLLEVLSLFVLFLLVAGCSATNTNSNEGTDKTDTSAKESEKGIVVDKGLLNVEVTLPGELFEGENMDELIAEAKADGVKEVIQQEDGSITYIMSKAQHKKMMQEMEDSVIEMFDSIKTDEEMGSIKEIEYNKDFSDITMIVDFDAYENSFDVFTVLGIGMTTMMYQLFNGADLNNYEITISIKDEQTGEIKDTIVYPEALEEITEDSE